MKLGFSTLGCPKWSFDTILERATKYGFNGFEVRGIQGQMDLLKIPEFAPNRRARNSPENDRCRARNDDAHNQL